MRTLSLSKSFFPCINLGRKTTIPSENSLKVDPVSRSVPDNSPCNLFFGDQDSNPFLTLYFSLGSSCCCEQTNQALSNVHHILKSDGAFHLSVRFPPSISKKRYNSSLRSVTAVGRNFWQASPNLVEFQQDFKSRRRASARRFLKKKHRPFEHMYLLFLTACCKCMRCE